ncbi:hypothetical protein HP532_27655 [Pseudomonas sp. CrR25]|nr:hypothetical protein [Pseudomonas sp. CrR25]
MSAWKTQKGDEWVYENGSVKSVADYNSESNSLLIRYISFAKNKASEKLLFNFLRETKNLFPETHIFIKSQYLDHKAEAVLNSLQGKGLIIFHTSDSPLLQKELISLKNKKWWSLW